MDFLFSEFGLKGIILLVVLAAMFGATGIFGGFQLVFAAPNGWFVPVFGLAIAAMVVLFGGGWFRGVFVFSGELVAFLMTASGLQIHIFLERRAQRRTLNDYRNLLICD